MTIFTNTVVIEIFRFSNTTVFRKNRHCLNLHFLAPFSFSHFLQALSLTLTLTLTSSKPSPPSSAPSSPPNSSPFSSPASTSPSSASFTPTPPTALLEEELFRSTPCFLRALFLIALTASYLGFQGFVDSDKCYLSASFTHRCTSRCKLGFATPCRIPTPTSRALS